MWHPTKFADFHCEEDYSRINGSNVLYVFVFLFTCCCLKTYSYTVHVAADTNPVVVDDWLAEPEAEEDAADDCDADDDDVDGNGAVADPRPFGLIIMVAFFSV